MHFCNFKLVEKIWNNIMTYYFECPPFCMTRMTFRKLTPLQCLYLVVSSAAVLYIVFIVIYASLAKVRRNEFRPMILCAVCRHIYVG